MRWRWLALMTALLAPVAKSSGTTASGPLASGAFESEILEPHAAVKQADRLIQVDDRYILVDSENNRLLFLDGGLNVVRQLGQIGQGPGDFYHPVDVAVDPKKNIYVQDESNRRLEIFDWNGNFKGQFATVPKPVGLAVNSKGEILLGQPQEGALVSVYDHEGNLLRRFGQLKKFSDFYGEKFRDKDGVHRFSINRALLAVDGSDNVYVGFVGAPFFQKYGPDGTLLFERMIEGPQGEGVIRRFQEVGKSPIRRGYMGDGAAIPAIINGVAVHEPTGRLLFVFQWDRGWLYVADPMGHGLAVLESPSKELLFHSISFSQDNRSLLASRDSVVKYSEFYRLHLPAELLEPARR